MTDLPVDGQLTKERAIALGKSEVWKDWTLEQRAKVGMSQRLLCMPFNVLHEAVEKTLGRPVYTHEILVRGSADQIMAELFDGALPPTLGEIMDLIPESKRMVVLLSPDDIKPETT